MRQLGVLVVVQVLDDNGAILGNGLDAEGTLVGLLNDNIQAAADWGLGLSVLVILLIIVLGLASTLVLAVSREVLVSERRVVVERLVLVAVEVGDRERDGDPAEFIWLAKTPRAIS